jgi:hypothetical protein
MKVRMQLQKSKTEGTGSYPGVVCTQQQLSTKFMFSFVYCGAYHQYSLKQRNSFGICYYEHATNLCSFFQIRSVVGVVRKEGIGALYSGLSPAVARGLTYGGKKSSVNQPPCFHPLLMDQQNCGSIT